MFNDGVDDRVDAVVSCRVVIAGGCAVGRFENFTVRIEIPRTRTKA